MCLQMDLKTRWSGGGGANTWFWCIVTNLEEGLEAFYNSQRADFNTFWKKKEAKEGNDRLALKWEKKIKKTIGKVNFA